MYEESDRLIQLQRENDTAVGAVEAFLEWAKKEDNQKIRELVLSLADCIIRACLVRK